MTFHKRSIPPSPGPPIGKGIQTNLRPAEGSTTL